MIVGNEHVSLTCTKLGSVLQVQQSKDPEGLRVFYYLVRPRCCSCTQYQQAVTDQVS